MTNPVVPVPLTRRPSTCTAYTDTSTARAKRRQEAVARGHPPAGLGVRRRARQAKPAPVHLCETDGRRPGCGRARRRLERRKLLLSSCCLRDCKRDARRARKKTARRGARDAREKNAHDAQKRAASLRANRGQGAGVQVWVCVFVTGWGRPSHLEAQHSRHQQERLGVHFLFGGAKPLLAHLACKEGPFHGCLKLNEPLNGHERPFRATTPRCTVLDPFTV